MTSNRPCTTRRTAQYETVPDGPNICYKVTQDKGYRPGLADGSAHLLTIPQAASTAFNFNWYNVVDSVIVFSRGVSPAAMEPKKNDLEMPVIRYWSQTTYQTWANLHDATHPSREGTLCPECDWTSIAPFATNQNVARMRSFLNWIVIEGIVGDPDAHSIIKRCLWERTGDNKLPQYSPARNVVSFSLGHWCFHALLATKSSRGIAFLLGQHKRSDLLGHKILDGVGITSGKADTEENKPYGDNPTLLWHVSDYTDAEIVEMRRLENMYVGRRDAKGDLTYGDMR